MEDIKGDQKRCSLLSVSHLINSVKCKKKKIYFDIER